MGWLKEWRERWRVRRTFAKYLDPEMVDRLSKTPSLLSVTQVPATIPFILLQVRDDRPDQVSPRLATALDIVIEKEGVVCDFMSSITLSVFGFPVSAGMEQDRANHADCVAYLMRALSPDVRLVYGVAEGLIGNVGSSTRLHYGPVIPHFANVLEALLKLEFGDSRALAI